jgi:hypothetical protein
MANLLAYGFGIPKSERIVALSASKDVFVTIRGMAGRNETISSLTVESLLVESESLWKKSKAQVAIARDQDDEHAYEWEVAIQLSDSHKQKNEEGLLLHTKLLAFVEARKNARFLVKRAEDANDVRAIGDWYPMVKAANKVLALYDAEEIANEQKRIEAKRGKRSPPARKSNDDANKKDTNGVDEEEETDDDSSRSTGGCKAQGKSQAEGEVGEFDCGPQSWPGYWHYGLYEASAGSSEITLQGMGPTAKTPDSIYQVRCIVQQLSRRDSGSDQLPGSLDNRGASLFNKNFPLVQLSSIPGGQSDYG